MSLGFGMAELLIYKSTDAQGEEWVLQEAHEVPMQIKGNPDTMGMLKEGHGAQLPDEECWYIGRPVTETPEKIIQGMPWRNA